MWKILLLLCTAVFAQQLTQRVGALRQCVNNQLYELSYNVDSLSDRHFIQLENVPGLVAVDCDIDSTRFLMSFDSTKNLASFISAAPVYESFVTSFGKFAECVPKGQLLLHRVTGASQIASRQLELMVAPARYDEVMENANVSLNHVGACSSNDFVCLGVNTDGSCERAAKSIPIFNNKFLDIQCTNCFLGFHTEVFFNMKIVLWKLSVLEGGLRSMGINAGLVLDLDSNARWSAAIDKTYDLVKEVVVLKFSIGPIPIRIWFEIPVRIKADVMASESAHVQAGALATYNLGDLYLSWTPKDHWVMHKPTPKFSWTPVLSGDANAMAHVDFAIIPTLKMHVENIFNFDVTLDPTLHLDIQGKGQVKPPSAEVCADLTYDATIISNCDLSINVPWTHIKVDKSWGPTEIMNTGVQPIAHKCVAARR